MNIKSKLFSQIVFFILFVFLILPLWLNKKFGLIYYEQFIFKENRIESMAIDESKKKNGPSI